jgi:hypothetical protein
LAKHTKGRCLQALVLCHPIAILPASPVSWGECVFPNFPISSTTASIAPRIDFPGKGILTLHLTLPKSTVSPLTWLNCVFCLHIFYSTGRRSVQSGGEGSRRDCWHNDESLEFVRKSMVNPALAGDCRISQAQRSPLHRLKFFCCRRHGS